MASREPRIVCHRRTFVKGASLHRGTSRTAGLSGRKCPRNGRPPDARSGRPKARRSSGGRGRHTDRITGVVILAAGALLSAGILASLLAGRLRVPSLLVLLAVGMAIGSDGLGWIAFSDYELARDIGIVALALILFEGGLASGWGEIRPVLLPSIGLATVGTFVSAMTVGLLARWILDLPTLDALLLGSIVAATDGAAVFAILRGSSLPRRLARTLEGEAGMNDPVAILLVLGFVEWIRHPDYGIVDFAGLFVSEIAIGAAVGLAVGVAARRALARVELPSAGLVPVASMAAAALSFGGAQALHGSGFLAVFLTGLMLASTPVADRRLMETFHQGLAWVGQLVLFLMLGLLVFPSELPGVAFRGLLVALFLTLIARPLGTLVGTLGARFSLPELTVLSWSGLRGGAPVVLATFPVIDRLPHSIEFFNIVFFAVVVSAVAQGTTVEALARRLGVTSDEAALPEPLIDPGTLDRLGAEAVEYLVRPTDPIVGLAVRDLGMPADALVNIIARGDQALPPRGDTIIESGDRLLVLVRHEAAVAFRALIHRWRTDFEPVAPQPAVGARVGLVGAETVEVAVRAADPIVGLPVRSLGMPGDALLELIVRGGRTIPPRGSTRVEAGDTLLVLVPHGTVEAFRGLVRRWRSDYVPEPEDRYDVRGLPEDVTGADIVVYDVADGDRIAGRSVADLGLPEDALLHLVVRDAEAIPPRGGTRIAAGDRLYVLVRHEAAERFRAVAATWKAVERVPPPPP